MGLLTKRILLLLLLLTTLCTAPHAKADDPTLGNEFEFQSRRGRAVLLWPGMAAAFITGLTALRVTPLTPATILGIPYALVGGQLFSNEIAAKDRLRMLNALQDLSGQRDFTVSDGTVTYPDGWWFRVGRDPTVVEIQHAKYTPQEFKTGIKDRIQRDIYDVAASVGLRPVKQREGVAASGGHLNIGFEQVFGNDSRLLMNFLIDFANHAEISTGVLVNDGYSAAALRLSAGKRKALKALQRQLAEMPLLPPITIAQIYLQDVLGGEIKRNALVFQDLVDPDSSRMEIRSSPTFASADELEKITDLILARIEYLKTLDKPLELIDERPITDPFLQAKAFNEYLRQSGKNWEDYRPLIAPKFRKYRAGPDGELIAPNPLVRIINCATSYFRIGLY